MTDNRTTELRISEPLRGFIRHQSNRAYIDGGQARWLTDIADKIDAKHEQAIAATLGRGTCEWVLEHSGTLYDKWRCSNCGYLFVESRVDQGIKDDFDPNYCPNCGAKVVSA